ESVRDMRPSDYENFRELARTFRLFAPTDVPDEARVVAKEQIDGHDVWVVTARNADEGNRWSFDVTSGLLVRRITTTDGPVGRVPRQTDFGDYPEAGGAITPHSIRISLIDPWVGSARTIEQQAFGVPIDEALFARPH
ncbi:MAG TPA: hypothetical protein VN605_01390, partial [Thermoanaerobaculia bacterium]|nr:hypothetical protein [Thermoanaerobaculia bacterium]